MKQKLKRFISVLFLAVIVLNGIALTNQKAYADVSPEEVNSAIGKFADAVGTFAASDASDKAVKIADFCSRLGGLTSAASGVIGILEMAGIIKGSQMPGQILNVVKDVQTTLDNMNKTLDRIEQDLVNIQVAQQEIDRNTKATTMSTNWNNFNTHYTEKLQTYVSEYEAKINSGIKAWWGQASHEGVYVLMTKKYTEEDALTYSKKKYSEGLPAKSDINDETVSTEWSIGIPAECMPNTSAVTFNVDTYRDEFKKIMVTALENAIKDNKLASNCGASVKSEYNSSSKQAMLESYADNVLNTVIYKISCEVMSTPDNNSWVAQVISLYKQYCDNILQQNSGVNAFLNYIYFTHAFEGEVKEDIEKFLDGMTAQAGFYGEFALTCAGQDSLQTTATKEQIREYFTNTVISIADRKAKAITGKNNYCYITGTILEADTTSIGSYMYIGISNYGRTYTGCDAHSWEATIPSIVDSTYMLIIYKQYTKLPQGTNSFAEYLNKFGAQNDDSSKTYVTNYRGQETFAFGEGIHMQAHKLIPNVPSGYFWTGDWYNIDVGTPSKVEQEYYHCHDKVVGDLFDTSNGNPSLGAIIAARAFYGESHTLWTYDEAYAFHSEGVSYSEGKGYEFDKTVSLSKTVDILKSTPHHDLNGDTIDPANPFFAFDMVSLTRGVSDQMDPHYEKTSKDITEVRLDSNSFAYTGQPIEPAVTVFASDDVVPESGYTVKYVNNIESGDCAVVRVEAVGDYAGVITRHFTITANDESDSPTTSPTRHHSSGGCNAMSGIGVVLGLAFVIRKFRRQ